MQTLTMDQQLPGELIRSAREGNQDALGELLARYRNYLRLLARGQVGGRLGARIDPSDLVQETLAEVHRDFAAFRGTTEAELLAWLRRILARNLTDEVRRHQRELRDHRREQSLEELLERSNANAERLLASTSSPSARAERRERSVLLADALAQLSDAHQEIIVLRHFERLKFEEIAARMGRSSGAVRMLWARALEALRGTLEEEMR